MGAVVGGLLIPLTSPVCSVNIKENDSLSTCPGFGNIFKMCHFASK